MPPPPPLSSPDRVGPLDGPPPGARVEAARVGGPSTATPVLGEVGVGLVAALICVALLLGPGAEGGPWRGMALFGLGTSFLGVAWVGRRVDGRLEALRRALDGLGGKESVVPEPAGGGRSRGSLAQALADARRRVAAERAQLELHSRSLERRLIEAAEQVDATARRRRGRFAELANGLRVVLEVGANPQPATLIDLTYDRLVLGLSRETAPGLARGMIARATLEQRGDSSSAIVYECTSTGSFELGQQVHLTFKVHGGIRLDELPSRIGEILNQRRRLRTRPSAGSPLRVAVRRSAHDPPTAAEVVDLSSNGMKVILPLSLRRFSTWGVHLQLAIRIEADAEALRLSGRVRSCAATADERVTVGIEFDADATPDFELRQRALAQWVVDEDRIHRQRRARLVG